MWLFSSRRKRPKVSAPVRRPSHRPQLEVLEDRCLLSAGALDPTFGNGAGYVTANAPQGGRVLLQPDGKMVVASFQASFSLVRFNSDGSLDTSFGTGGSATTSYFIQGQPAYSTSAALQANGDIIEGGYTYFNNTTNAKFALVRYTPNGVLDSSFGNQGKVITDFGPAVSNALVYEIMVQPDGKIIAAGSTGAVGPNILLARYNVDGSLDASFGTNGEVNISVPSVSQNEVADARLQSDGKIVTNGSSIITGQGRAYELARFNSDGSLDTTFGTGGLVRTSFGLPGSSDYVSDIAIQSDGKIVAVGSSSYDVSGDREWSLARYDSSGNLDPTFGNGGKVTELVTSVPDNALVGEAAYSPTLQSDGKIVVAGSTGSVLALARYDAFGNRDSTFGNGGLVTSAIGKYAYDTAIYPQAGTPNDGKIVTAGNSGSSPNSTVVARFSGDPAAVVGFPSPTTAGAAGAFTVTVKNPSGSTNTGYTGTVHFTSSDPQAVLPADYTFTAADQGVHTFSATLKTAGTQSLSIADTINGIFGSQTGIAVISAAPSTLSLAGFPSATNVGITASYTVTAQDVFGNAATSYTGTVHFSSSDPLAGLPTDYTFIAADNGAHTFSATLNTTGTQSLTATDTTTANITGSQTGITVYPAGLPAVTFSVNGFPSPTTAGVSKTITVTARDANGNVAGSYRGTVHFTSSDPQAVLPADYTFTGPDQGVHTFSVTLKTAASQSLTAKDTTTGSITGSQAGIVVKPAAASQFILSAPSSVTHGKSFTLTLTVKDAFGNVVTGYTGTVHFTSSDGTATLPANYTFKAADAGVHNFTVTLRKKGTQSITVTDTLNSALTATDSINVV